MHTTPSIPSGDGAAPDSPEHYSGVLIMCRPEEMDEAARQVASLQGAEIHLRDGKAGRMIAVLTSRDARGQEQLLEEIRRVPAVAAAALVYHYVDRDPGAGPPAAGGGGDA